MTGCRKFAPVSALVLAALAASVTRPLPQARAASDEASEAGRGSGQGAIPADAGYVELQRQVNELRGELLDQRERAIDRRQQANGTVIGGGGLWFYARLRTIAADVRIGFEGRESTLRGLMPRLRRPTGNGGPTETPMRLSH